MYTFRTLVLFFSGFNSLTSKLCLNLDLRRPLPISAPPCSSPPPPPAAALVSVASPPQGTSSSSVSVPSTVHSGASLSGESHAVGVDSNSAMLFREFLEFIKSRDFVLDPFRLLLPRRIF